MTVEELQKEKKAFENEIAQFLGNRVNTFQTKTGVLLNSISIFLIDVSSLGSPPHKILGEVEISIEL